MSSFRRRLAASKRQGQRRERTSLRSPLVQRRLRSREPRWAKLAIIHRLDKETSGLIVFGAFMSCSCDGFRSAAKTTCRNFARLLYHIVYATLEVMPCRRSRSPASRSCLAGKSPAANKSLTEQFAARQADKTYTLYIPTPAGAGGRAAQSGESGLTALLFLQPQQQNGASRGGAVCLLSLA